MLRPQCVSSRASVCVASCSYTTAMRLKSPCVESRDGRTLRGSQVSQFDGSRVAQLRAAAAAGAADSSSSDEVRS